jgi:hypothetical protein
MKTETEGKRDKEGEGETEGRIDKERYGEKRDREAMGEREREKYYEHNFWKKTLHSRGF